MTTLASKIIMPKSMTEEFQEKVESAIGEFKDMEIFHNSVVVAKFVRTHVSKSILAASSTQLEDKWQGKVGLVVAVGPSAFVDEPGFNFHGISVKPGEWVIYRNTDGWDFDYQPVGGSEKIPMRLLEDAHIKGRTTRPDMIW